MPGIGWMHQPDFCRDDTCLAVRQTGDTIKLLRFAAGREHRVLIANTPGRVEQGHERFFRPRGWLFLADLPIEGQFGLDASENLLSRNANGVFRWPVRVEAGPPEKYHLGPPQRVTSQRTGRDGEFSSSTDGRVLAFAHGEISTHAIVVDQGPPLRTLTLGPQHDLRHIRVSPDGRWVVTGSHWPDPKGEHAKLWDTATGKLIKVLPTAPYAFPRFSSNGRWLQTEGGPGYWCEVGTWEPKAVQSPSGLLSQDGRLLACGSGSAGAGFGEIQLVDFETGKEIARLGIPDQTRLGPVYFSPDGALSYAVGVETGHLHRWDLRLIRSQLAELGLDIDLPLYGEQPERPLSWPLPAVTVHQPELATDAAKVRHGK